VCNCFKKQNQHEISICKNVALYFLYILSFASMPTQRGITHCSGLLFCYGFHTPAPVQCRLSPLSVCGVQLPAGPLYMAGHRRGLSGHRRGLAGRLLILTCHRRGLTGHCLGLMGLLRSVSNLQASVPTGGNRNMNNSYSHHSAE
jgi:hypothetical protein